MRSPQSQPTESSAQWRPRREGLIAAAELMIGRGQPPSETMVRAEEIKDWATTGIDVLMLNDAGIGEVKAVKEG